MKKFILIIAFLILVGCTNLNRSYVEADIKTYNIVAPELVATYKKIDDPFIRWVKLNTIKTWTERITEALQHPELAELKMLFTPMAIQTDPKKEKPNGN